MAAPETLTVPAPHPPRNCVHRHLAPLAHIRLPEDVGPRLLCPFLSQPCKEQCSSVACTVMAPLCLLIFPRQGQPSHPLSVPETKKPACYPLLPWHLHHTVTRKISTPCLCHPIVTEDTASSLFLFVFLVNPSPILTDQKEMGPDSILEKLLPAGLTALCGAISSSDIWSGRARAHLAAVGAAECPSAVWGQRLARLLCG